MKYSFKNIPHRVTLKYFLLQLPALALVLFVIHHINERFELPLMMTWGTIAAWIVKDILILPLVWRSYESRGESAMEKMRGRRGTVHRRLEPAGMIKIGGELWQGEVKGAPSIIEAGEPVTVVGHEGLKLLVVPCE